MAHNNYAKKNYAKKVWQFELIIALAVFFALLVPGVSWVISYSHQVHQQAAQHTDIIAFEQARNLERNLVRSLSGAIILGTIIESLDGDTRKFEQYADSIFRSLGGITNLQLAPDGIIRAIHPLHGHEKALGHNLLIDDARHEEAKMAITTRRLTLAGPFNLVQGGIAVVGRQPVFVNRNSPYLTIKNSGSLPDINWNGKQFWGFASVLIDLDTILDLTDLAHLDEKAYRFKLLRYHPDTGLPELIAGTAEALSADAKQHEINLPNSTWTLEIARTQPALSSLTLAILMILVLLLNILIASWIYHLLVRPKVLQVRSAERLQAIIDSQPDLITRFTPNGVITLANEAYCDFVGKSREALLGSSIYQDIPTDEVALVQAYFKSFSRHDRTAKKNENQLTAADGTKYLFEWWNTAYYDINGNIVEFQSVGRDITERKRTETLVWTQANFDHLTGLPNRRMLHDRLEQEIKEAQRSQRQIALLLFDLDRFKEVNDLFGHDKGDLLLQQVAERLRYCVRGSDTLARLGGDEFIVIIGELHNPGHTERIASSILRGLAEPFTLGLETVHISTSIGITLYPQDTEEIETLIRNADQAMYAAKAQGGNCFQYFTPAMQRDVQYRVSLSNDLRDALADKQFYLVYQPVIELQTGAIRGAEALIRWRHPSRGLVSPAEFIPIAEETGMIIDIGDWVFQEVLQQMARWRFRHRDDFQVNVNVSPVQLRSSDHFIKNWLQRLQELDLNTQRIGIEITEGVLLKSDDEISDKLAMLRDAGIRIAVDDFGTGYSSLAYIYHFNFDYLKIDQSFIRNLAVDTDAMALAEAIIVMAHKLNLKVIAEGIETGQQRDLMMTAGCDYGQGFLFSKPIPADAFESLLTASHSDLNSLPSTRYADADRNNHINLPEDV